MFLLRTATVLLCIAGCAAVMKSQIAADRSPGGPPNHSATKADVERWMTDLSNWGRWGKNDELGTLNLITPRKRRQAGTLAKDGVTVSLSHEVLTEKSEDDPNPFVRTMTSLPQAGRQEGFAMDTYSVSYHGIAHTHLDALCHAFVDGKMYNGFSPLDISAGRGCPKASVISARQGIVTRGVLIDIARLRGVPYLEPGTPIYAEDLDAWERSARVKVSAGDAVFIRNGRWARRAEKGPAAEYAGLHATAAKWLYDRDVAVLGSDSAQDVEPSGVAGVRLPIHELALVAMGMYLIDNCDLEDLAKTAAARGRWEFMLVVSPIAVRGGTGSPVNPIAIF